jgi:aryl-alcohol dehydrogenase-like predicted oxidoreductase
MRYKLFGNSGLRVSELALGTMTFGEDWGWGASKEVSQLIFDHYAEAGGNFIDTSCNYTNGTSEKFVGEFIQNDRDHFIVGTKYSLTLRRDDPNFGGNHRKNMMRSVDESLKRLNTDYIDLYWLHMWDYATPVDEVLRAFDDLVRQGKVLYVGISDTPAWVVSYANAIAELRGWNRFAGLQVPYSLADRAVERELLPMAKSFDMAVTAWGLLEGGELTGKYNTPTSEPKRSSNTSDTVKKLAEVLIQVANEIGRTPSQVAINWVRQQKAAQIVPILGARTEAQIKDNLACLDFSLTDEQWKRLSDASPISLGFPSSFLHSDHVHGLIYGDTFSKLDNHRA